MVFKINKFGHRILALLKQQREKPENVMPERGFEPRPLRCRSSAPPVALLYQAYWEQAVVGRL